MAPKNEEELEFMSVSASDNYDDGNMTSQSYGDDAETDGRSGGYRSSVGSWLLNQSKVR